MAGFAQIYFVDWPRKSTSADRRYNGHLAIPSKGFACEADSGSSGKYSLPEGRYVVSHFRDRSESNMTREGVGFSVDLSDKFDPAKNAVRSLLRIHPDGGAPGTEGCIGVLTKVAECRDHLKEMLPDSASTASLLVVRSPDRQLGNLVMSLLRSVVADD